MPIFIATLGVILKLEGHCDILGVDTLGKGHGTQI